MKRILLLASLFLLLSSLGKSQQVIIYTLDNHDRIDKEKYPDSLTIKAAFDSVGNIKTRIIENPCSDRSNPVISFSTPTTFCQGDSVKLTAPLSLKYQWSRGDTTRTITVKGAGSYTVTTFNTLNCFKTSSPVTVKVNALPQPSIDTSGLTSFCPGLSITLASKLTGKYSWNTGDTTKTISADTTKNYTLTYTDTNGCKATVSKQVTLYPKPVAAFTPNSTAQCFGNNFTYTNGSTISSGAKSYVWTFGEGSADTSTSPSRSYTVAGTYVVKLIATSNRGCKDSTQKNITVYPKPKTGFTVNAVAQCVNGNSYTLTDTSKISSGTFSSLWSFGDGTQATTLNPQKIYTSPSTYTVKLVSVSTNGCKDSTTKQVTVFPKPTVGFTVNNTGQCVNTNTFVFTDTSKISSGTLTRVWSIGDTTRVKNFTYTTSGTYSLTLRVTSNNGCIDSLTRQLTVHPKPTVGFTINIPSQCVNGNSFIYTDTSQISSGTMLRTWEFGDGSTATNSPSSKTYSGPGTYSVKLLLTSNYGCKDSITKTVTVFPKPTVGYTINSAAQCVNGNTFAFNDTSKISSGLLTRLWKFGNNTTDTALNAVKVYDTASSYTVRLISISNNGCKDSTQRQVVVYPKPTVGFTQNLTAQCYTGNSFILNDTSKITTGTITRVWKFGDGATSTTGNPTKTFGNSGSYQIKLIETSNFNCKDSVSKTFTVYPQTAIGFTINDSDQCYSGNSFGYTDTSNISSGSYTRQWYLGNGTTATSSSVTKTYDSAKTYTIKLVTTTDHSCLDTIQKSIIVYPQPKTGFTQTNFAQCQKANVFVLKDTSIIASGILTRLWKFGDGTTSTSGTNNKSYSSPGTYFVKLIETSGFGCKDSTTKTVTVYPQTNIGFTINNDSQCLKANRFVFSDTSTISSGTKSSLWKFGNGYFDTATISSHTYKNDSAYNVTLITTSNYGCKDTMVKHVVVHPKTNIGFTINNDSQCLKANIFNYNNTSTIATGSNSFLWNLGDGSTSTSLSTNHTYSYNSTFTVRLISTSNYQCKDTVDRTITVHPQTAIGFIINNDSQCYKGNTFAYTDTSRIASGTKGVFWDFGDGVSNTDSLTTHTYTTYGSFQTRLITTSNYNCKDTIGKQVIVHPQTAIGYVINNDSQCLKANHFSYSNTSTIPSGTKTFLWNFGDNTYSVDSSPVHTYVHDGIFTTALITTSNYGCKDTTEKHVIVHPQTDIGFAILNDSQCLKGNTFTFTDTSTLSTGTKSYQWNFGDGIADTDSVSNHTYTQSGNFNVTLITTSNFSCKDTIGKSVVIHPQTDISYTVDIDSQCLKGNTFSFNNTSTIRKGTKTFLWDFTDGITSTDSIPIHIYSSAGTHTITLITTSNYECKDTFTRNVVVHPQTDTGFTLNNNAQCLTGNSFACIDTSQLATGYKSSFWDFGDGDTGINSPISHTYINYGTYFITLITTTNFSCKDSITKALEVYPQMKPILTSSDTARCYRDNNFSFAGVSSTIPKGKISDFHWWFGDGDSGTGIYTHKKHYSNTGTYEVTLKTISDKGCTDTVNQTITVHPQALPEISVSDTALCWDRNQIFFNGSKSTIPYGMIAHYLWNWGDGNYDTGKFPLTKSYTYPDTFSVMLKTTSQEGCMDSVHKQVVIHPQANLGFVQSDTSRCLRDNIFTFDASLSTIPKGSVITSYFWSYGDTGIDSGIVVSHIYKYEDTFSVHLKTATANGCIDSLTKKVIVHPRSQLSFSTNKDAQCLKGNEFAFDASLSNNMWGSIDSFYWDFGDGTTDNMSKPQSKSYAQHDTFKVQLNTVSYFGCRDTLVQSVIVHPQADTGFTINTPDQCLKGNSYTFINSSNISSGTYSILWDLGDGVTDTTSMITHSYFKDSTYTVSLVTVSDFSCKDTISAQVLVHPQPRASLFNLDTTTICNGTYSMLSANKGQKYSYEWYLNNAKISGDSSILKAFLAGSYRVIVGNQFTCNDTSNTIAVTVLNLPKAHIISNGDTSFCDGDSVVLKTDDGIGYSYKWYRNDTLLVNQTGDSCIANISGTFKAVTTLNGCDSIPLPILVTVNPNPPKPIISNSNNTLSSSIQQSSYQWYFNDTMLSAATFQNVEAFNDGRYKVSVTNSFNCTTMSDEFHFSNPKLNLDISPNPTERDFTIKSSSLIVSYIIADANGKKVYSTEVNPPNFSVSCSQFISPGVYYITVNTNHGSGVRPLVIRE